MTSLDTPRQIEIRQIVDEEMDACFAEQDRHRSGRWIAPNYNARFCSCGWQAPAKSRDYLTSVGLHIALAKKKARKIADANIQRRMEETRPPVV